MTERDTEIAKAMQDAQATFETLNAAMVAWAMAQPDNSLRLAGMAAGAAKLAGMAAQRITDQHARCEATASAIATLLMNVDCDVDMVLAAAREGLSRVALASAEVAGNA